MKDSSKNAEENQPLWQRFKEGDLTAFDSLIKEHYAALFSYGLKFSKDKELLKDRIGDIAAPPIL